MKRSSIAYILEPKWYEVMDKEPEKGEEKPWKELLYDYSQSTTFHGVPYTTGPPEKCRRAIWVVLVLAAFATFLYLFITRLRFYYSYPTSVAVEVAYKDELNFPAVTICNQNQFRLTKLQEEGLTDLFNEKYATPKKQSAAMTASCSERFSKVRDGCLNANFSVSFMREYKEVTLQGCKYLCQNLDTRTCGAILFLPLSRSCILQPVVSTQENGEDCQTMEIHRRHRCSATVTSLCDFDGSECHVIQDEEEDDTDWLEVRGNVVQPGQADHTTRTERGRLLYLTESLMTTDVRAVLLTPFSETDGICVELFYTTRGQDVATLSISYRGEDYIQKTLESSSWNTSTWSQMFARLPSGLNQILIEGKKSANTYAGILVDSINIAPCQDFEKNCMRFIGGSGYTGNIATTSKGQCKPWKDIPEAWYYRFPEHILSAENKCRFPSSANLKYGTPNKPWCYITKDTYSACDVPYCECKANYFACGDGRCLPKTMLCDGTVDCPDAKDETDYCEAKRMVTCNFIDNYLCGYNGTKRVKNGAFWSYQPDATFVSPSATGRYLKVEIGEVGDPTGLLITPLTTSSSESCLTLLFRIGDSASSGNVSNKLEIRMTTIPESLSGKLLWWSKNASAGSASVTVPARPNGAYLAFRGTIHNTSEVVAIANVKLSDNECPSSGSVSCSGDTFLCDGKCVSNTKKCDGITDCFGDVDEDESACAAKSVDCDFKDDFLCGYIHSTTLPNFTWSREMAIDFAGQPAAGESPTMLDYACSFPFEYNNASHNACITDNLHPGESWCSLDKVYNENTSHWDYCTSADFGHRNGQLFSGTKGLIQSYKYPNPYPNDERARYEVVLPTGIRIQLFVENLDVERTEDSSSLTGESSFSCGSDYLAIPLKDLAQDNLTINTNDYIVEEVDESSLSFEPYPPPGLGKYIKICGKIPPKDPLLSEQGLSTTGNRLRIFFISDGTGSNRGFSLRYTSQMYGAAGSLDYTLSVGIPATNKKTVNPNSLAFLKSPEVEVTSASCLEFKYSLVSEMTIVTRPTTAEGESKTVWHSSVFSGHTWSRGWANLPVGKYYLLLYHRYSFDVKLKTTKERPLAFTMAISNIKKVNGPCQIQAQGSLACTFDDEDQCGYMDQSSDMTYWTRVNRLGSYFMAAKLKNDAFSNPAVLISKEVTVKNKTCLGLHYFCYRCNNNDLIITLSLVTSSGETPLKTFPHAKDNSYGVRATDLGPGTFKLKISVSGIGVIYLNRTFLEEGDCASMNNDTSFKLVKLFEKWSYLAFTSVPSTEEYINSEFAKGYNGYESDFSGEAKTATRLLTGVVGGVLGGVGDLVGGVGGLVGDLGDGLGDLTGGLVGSLLGDDLGDAVGDTLGGLVGGVGDTVGDLGGTLGSLGGLFGQLVAPSSGSNATGSPMVPISSRLTSGDSQTTDSSYAPWNDPNNYSNGPTTTTNTVTVDYSTPTNYTAPNYGQRIHSNMSAFYLAVGHQLNDLKYECKWNGTNCKHLKPIVTDLGLCITFNYDSTNILKTRHIGSGFGLRMTLNIEQYEYIQSINPGSGLKVYLHHQDDLPRTRDLGFAVYPGVHALVAAKLNVAKGLEKPYGKCGKVELKLFGDVNYTRPRCEVECLTDAVFDRCKCKLAYMPGDMPVCDLTQYLDCVVYLVYVQGLQNSQCTEKCLDACEIQTYSADVSYGGISTLSIDSVVSEGKTALEKKYLAATEISQRVDTGKLQSTVTIMKNASQSLVHFNNISVGAMDIACNSIGKATEVLVDFFKQDLAKFAKGVAIYQQFFNVKVGYLIPDFLSQVDMVLPQLRYIIFSKINTSREDIKNSDLAFTLTKLSEYTKLIGRAIYGAYDTTNGTKSYMPPNYVPNDGNVDCLHPIIMAAYMERNVTVVNSSIQSDSGILEPVRVLEKTITTTKQCFSYYYSTLKTADEYISQTYAAADKLKKDLSFSYDSVAKSFKLETDYINSNISWLMSLWEAYSRNDSTKAQLAATIGADQMDQIAAAVSDIKGKIESGPVRLLTERIDSVLATTVSNYVKMINILTNIDGFYKDLKWEHFTRQLQIWQVPTADVDTPNVLRTTVKKEEIWRTWPRTITLADMNNIAEEKLETVLGVYGNSLRTELHKAEVQLISAESFVKEALANMVIHLEAYKNFLQVNKDFILQNFIKMDVYFAVLKYEEVTLQVAYEVVNFLSEVGGYMGLLIGGSCLTLCEILDLFIFNGCKKTKSCCCKGSKVKAIDAEGIPEKKEPPT